ncbi:MAG TPA: hypothetical protein VJW17_01595, partial [Pyrinomonadaceae bacterium]|nr:hypothetical protein [Pyrinomonadaceae bacterium]
MVFEAIEKLAQGQHLEPKLENTIEEVHANGLFRWLRDFGPRVWLAADRSSDKASARSKPGSDR